MMTLVIQVDVGRSDRPVIGMDTIILVMPQKFYVDIDGKPTLVVQAFAKFLREISVKSATDLGELLHHGEYVLTTDPDVVARRGVIHDCDQCREGTANAVRMMQEKPDMEVLVGTLYWSG